jgi:hypothetical protein
LATTGAHIIMFLAFLAVSALTLGRMLLRRGRGTTIGEATFD